MKKIKNKKLNNDQKNKVIIIFLLLITVLSLSTTIYFVFVRDNNISINSNNNITQEKIEKNPDSIAIPGYEMLTLIADSKKQTICFQNPEQNTCWFVIRLYLEDNTLLYESDYISPGKTSKPIVLTQELEKGIYKNAVLEYSCFKMDSQKTPLNGAKTKLTLNVTE